ncbi:MAG: hypothetical protein HYV27_03850 [Candidatus Hydrogenedentes bacterium]|nr:hypothetical protein [Candidatus Hydrogenedentota bacterium]
MSPDELQLQLDALEKGDYFAQDSDELTERWRSSGVGPEAIPIILRFMEANPHLDYGIPGALVHFMDEVDAGSYDKELMESIARRPTLQTIVVLHRLINAATASYRTTLLEVARKVTAHSLADEEVIEAVNRILHQYKT